VLDLLIELDRSELQPSKPQAGGFEGMIALSFLVRRTERIENVAIMFGELRFMIACSESRVRWLYHYFYPDKYILSGWNREIGRNNFARINYGLWQSKQ
jgi:hypothetical protein